MIWFRRHNMAEDYKPSKDDAALIQQSTKDNPKDSGIKIMGEDPDWKSGSDAALIQQSTKDRPKEQPVTESTAIDEVTYREPDIDREGLLATGATATGTRAKASTYKASTRDVTGRETVAEQLEGLLSKESDYMKRAQTRGMQYAQGRGLLNSSMASEAAMAAAIDAGLPIAQQDAETYFRQGLENQAAINKARSTSAQLLTQADIASAGNLTQAEIASAGNITEAAIASSRNLTQVETQRIQNAHEQFTQTRDLNMDYAITQLQQSSETARTQYREMSEDQRTEMRINAELAINDADNAARIAISNSEMDQADREAFLEYYGNAQRQAMVELTDAWLDPRMSDTQRTLFQSSINNSLTQNTELAASLIGLDIEVTPFEPNLTPGGEEFGGTREGVPRVESKGGGAEENARRLDLFDQGLLKQDASGNWLEYNTDSGAWLPMGEFEPEYMPAPTNYDGDY